MPKAAFADGVSLWYQERGPKGAPAVLALHGFTGTHRTWRGLVPAADAGGLRLLAPDLPGHGRTGGSDPVCMTMNRTTEALLQMPLPERFHVLGYSMGARLALHVARRAPGRVLSLVLESGSPGLSETRERERRRQHDERWALALEQDGIAAFAARWAAQPLFSSQRALARPARRRIARERLAQDPVGLAANLRGAGTGSQESLWEDLGRLGMPLLIVVGERDEKFVAIGRAMAGRLRQSRLRIISGSGHAPHIEAPAAFMRELSAFWSALPDPVRIPEPPAAGHQGHGSPQHA
jgi:2-succinyl-6-hydroxy-2,4-cyclohexadiene-1-carboxylate synthase